MYILYFLVFIVLAPFIITILFPNLCFGCTRLGRIKEYLNNYIYFSYFSWFAYVFIFIYYIYISSKFKNILLKYITILFCIFMIYIPMYPLLKIINIVLSIVYTNPPFIHDYQKIFPPSIQIEENSTIIINEFNNYIITHKPDCIRKNNPGFGIENNITEDNCWRSIYLKTKGIMKHDMYKHFPSTCELLKDNSIHNAFFSILDPMVEITPHTGYYKGYLRYHLGVVIPNNYTGRTDDKAYIVCGNEKYIWKQNNGIVFDDMFLHYVKNETNKRRVVLYIDIKRNNDSYFINKLNELGILLIENSILLNIFIKNQHNQTTIDSTS